MLLGKNDIRQNDKGKMTLGQKVFRQNDVRQKDVFAI
jgi:hypothetical protein